jgi:hypothetical protein
MTQMEKDPRTLAVFTASVFSLFMAWIYLLFFRDTLDDYLV